MAETTTVNRTVGFSQAFATVVGTVIGAGVFFKASAVTQYTGSVSLSMFAWLLGGIITLCAGLTTAELSAMYPNADGLMGYIDEAYGSFWGFESGWAQIIIYFPANMAAISYAFASQYCYMFSLKDNMIIPIAIIAIISLLIVNIISLKLSNLVTEITLLIKLIPLLALVIFGFTQKGQVDFSLFPIVAGPHRQFGTALGQALLATMFAYDGWIHVGNLSKEMKNTKRDLPRAITLGIFAVMIIYILVNAVFYWVKPVSQIAGNMNIASDVAKILFGHVGGMIVSLGIMVSCYGSLNGYVTTGMRIPYRMGQNDQLPFSKKLFDMSKINVFYIGGIFEVLLAILMLHFWTFDEMTNILVFVIWVFYTMAFAAVIKLRNEKPEIERPYVTPGYPVVPIIAIAGGLFILINTLITQFKLSMVGIIITALSIPIYLYKNRKVA